MPTCDYCGEETVLPYRCRYCGGSFCIKHRLPENHDCEGLEEISKKANEEGRIYRDVSEDLKRKPERDETPEEGPKISFRASGQRRPDRREEGTSSSTGIFKGLLGLLKGLFLRQATMILLILMVVFFIGQSVAQIALGGSYYNPPGNGTPADFGSLLYYLAPSQATVLERPWTLLTSIFAHGGVLHLTFNGIVLFFIGPALERRIGRNKFTYLFLGAGVLAGAAQIAVMNTNVVVLGASGAILAILGTLTALAPRMPVLLFFIIPMPLWLLTLGYGIISGFFAFTGGGGAVGHMAHFAGLVIGLIYGYKLRRDRRERYGHPLQRLLDRYHW